MSRKKWGPNRKFHVFTNDEHTSDFNCGQNDGTDEGVLTIARAMFQGRLPVVLVEVDRFGGKELGPRLIVD